MVRELKCDSQNRLVTVAVCTLYPQHTVEYLLMSLVYLAFLIIIIDNIKFAFTSCQFKTQLNFFLQDTSVRTNCTFKN